MTFVRRAQHTMAHIELHLSKTPCEYLQWRFHEGVDREAMSLSALLKHRDYSDDDSGVSTSAVESIERIVARRTKHGRLEYECEFAGKGSRDEDHEWRSLERLKAEGHEVTCLRFGAVASGVAAGLDTRR